MEKVLKLLKKPFLERSEDETEALLESLRQQAFLKPFFPDNYASQNLFLKICLLLMKYKTFSSNNILYNSDNVKNEDIFFITCGKAIIYELKTSEQKTIDFEKLILDYKTKKIQNTRQISISEKIIERNSSFGAFSENKNKNHVTIVVSLTHIDLVTVNKNQYSLLFLMKPGYDVVKIPMLKNILPDKTQLFYFFALGSLLKEQNFERNSWVFKENQKNDYFFYLIKDGSFRIYKKFFYSPQAKNVCLCEISQGELFGFESFHRFYNNNNKNTDYATRNYSIKVVSSEKASVYVFDMQELIFAKQELFNIFVIIKNIIELKEKWLASQINLIEKELKKQIFQEKKIMNIETLKEKEKKHIKDPNKVLQLRNIKTIIEKHFKVYEIISKNKSHSPENKNNEATNKEITVNNTNSELLKELNKIKSPKINVLPKLFLPFDTFLLKGNRSAKTSEQIKNEIYQEIKNQSWGFEDMRAVTLERKRVYSPKSPTISSNSGKKRKNSLSPKEILPKEKKGPQTSNFVYIKRIIYESQPNKIKYKRWKSPA